MPTATGYFDALPYNLNTNGKYLWLFGSSVLNNNVKVRNEANYKCNTVMFKGLIKIPSGFVDAEKVIFSNKSFVKFGKDFKFTGDIYLLSEKDFNEVFCTFSDESMHKFLESNNFKAVKAQNSNFESIYDDLKDDYNEHYGISDEDVLLNDNIFSWCDKLGMSTILISDKVDNLLGFT